MSTIQNYPVAVIVGMLAWLVLSVSFCVVVGLVAKRMRKHRERSQDRHIANYHDPHPGSPAA